MHCSLLIVELQAVMSAVDQSTEDAQAMRRERMVKHSRDAVRRVVVIK